MPKIIAIEFAILTGRRPRSAGPNARRGLHGQEVHPPIARLTLDTGERGFGWARVTEAQARRIVGCDPDALPPSYARFLDFALWDLRGVRAGVPVHALAASRRNATASAPEPIHVPCYDTSLYFDDLEIAADSEAAELIATEARDGLRLGHTAFKIKVGRGGMHMGTTTGLSRDISVVQAVGSAVREAVGSAARIMVDANNAYTVTIATDFLSDTKDVPVYWLEEAFHEDPVCYRALRERMAGAGVSTLIADGEGDASTRLEQWAADGLVDVLQYDLRARSFSGWLELGARLDEAGVRSAPHNYGEPTTNYYAAHLAPAIEGFEMVEWDEASVEGLDAPGYRISGGLVEVPWTPGFGLELDEKWFQRRCAENGYVVRE